MSHYASISLGPTSRKSHTNSWCRWSSVSNTASLVCTLNILCMHEWIIIMLRRRILVRLRREHFKFLQCIEKFSSKCEHLFDRHLIRNEYGWLNSVHFCANHATVNIYSGECFPFYMFYIPILIVRRYVRINKTAVAGAQFERNKQSNSNRNRSACKITYACMLKVVASTMTIMTKHDGKFGMSASSTSSTIQRRMHCKQNGKIHKYIVQSFNCKN